MPNKFKVTPALADGARETVPYISTAKAGSFTELSVK